jgi:imidazoleglycerol phosphate dehydratase HisB
MIVELTLLAISVAVMGAVVITPKHVIEKMDVKIGEALTKIIIFIAEH